MSEVARAMGILPGRVPALLRHPAVRLQMQIERERALNTLGCQAVHVVEEIMNDKEAPAHVRLKAATWTLESLGHAPKNQAQANPLGDKPLHEMTVAELASVVAEARKAISDASAPSGALTIESGEPNSNNDNELEIQDAADERLCEDGEPSLEGGECDEPTSDPTSAPAPPAEPPNASASESESRPGLQNFPEN